VSTRPVDVFSRELSLPGAMGKIPAFFSLI